MLEQWPDLEALQKVSRQKLKTFLRRDARSAPADVAAFLEDVRGAVPATRDGAVVRSAACFVQSVVRQLQVLRTALNDYEKRIEAIVGQHRMLYDDRRYSESLRRRALPPPADVPSLWKTVAGFAKPSASSA
ncbi:MAG: hypothetical protein JO097_16355 [Acidobacteriaceae bacterium]|nr:hypothetical protein [Acidobacteriaceae bacterium]MBV9294625.1 hypothetical protein [Acidobacteriaceae bacterium]MBV9767694.1 hypothetical protein [Acidobacteriaceae bacterium]